MMSLDFLKCPWKKCESTACKTAIVATTVTAIGALGWYTYKNIHKCPLFKRATPAAPATPATPASTTVATVATTATSAIVLEEATNDEKTVN